MLDACRNIGFFYISNHADLIARRANGVYASNLHRVKNLAPEHMDEMFRRSYGYAVTS